MDQSKELIHPMNSQEAMIARFQFLATPHGDGLDMNEPSYNQRVKEYLDSLTEDSMKEIISKQNNQILRDNTYVIPFLYARYKARPLTPDLYRIVEEMIASHPKQDNDHVAYLSKNFGKIIYKGKKDTDDRYDITPFKLFLIRNKVLGPLVFGAALFAIVYLILFFIGGI
jgi:hypothetical protein